MAVLVWVVVVLVDVVGGNSEYGGGGSLALSGHSVDSESLLWEVDIELAADADVDVDGLEVRATELVSCRWPWWLVLDVVRVGLRFRARAAWYGDPLRYIIFFPMMKYCL